MDAESTRERFALSSRRIVTPEGAIDGHVVVEGGRIVAVARGAAPAGVRTEDLGALALLPGLVDTHVHVNEPGRTEWEGFASASRAALAGGITTIVDMPLNSVPPTTTVEALELKRAAARVAQVEVGFWGGVVPGNSRQLEPLAAAGVRGFKCFLVPSGVEEFPHVGKRELSEAMPPHAVMKSPLSRCFNAGGQGEWSLAIRSMSPSISPCHSRSRCSSSRIGGAHLNSVAPSAISSAANVR